MAREGDRRGAYRVLKERPEEINHLEDLSIEGELLKWIFKRWDGKAWSELIWLRIGTGAGRL